MSIDVDGSVYITGFFTNPIVFGSIPLGSVGAADIYVVKYNASGNAIWAKSFGGSGDEGGFGVNADGHGNIYLTGYFSSPTISFGATILTNAGSNDIYVAKVSGTTGNVIWAIRDGGVGDDRGNGIKADAFDHVYVTGSFASATINFGSTTLTNAGSNDIFVAKYSGTNGNRIWAKGAGGADDDNGANPNDNGGSLTTDVKGNILIIGYFSSSSITFGSNTLTNSTGSFDLFIAKYDSTGTSKWARSAGGNGPNNDGAFAICTDEIGNSFITGAFDSPIITFGNTTLTHPLSTSGDVLLVKYDPNGDVVWAKNYGGIGDDLGFGICIDGSGNLYVVGELTSDIASFGSSTLMNAAAPFGDIFVAKFEASGNVIWATSVPGSNDDFGYDIALDNTSGAIYIAGNFASSSLVFGPNILTNSGSSDIYVAKLNSTITSTSKFSLEGLCIYPNPFNMTATIKLPDKMQNSSLVLFTIYGEPVKSFEPSSSELRIERENLSAGMYFLQLTQGKSLIATQKVVIID